MKKNVIFDSEKGDILIEEKRWETWKPTPQQCEYVHWVYNPDNLYNCEERKSRWANKVKVV